MDDMALERIIGIKEMKKYIIIGIAAVLGVGFLSLLTIDIPAPTEKVERTIPDDEFPK